MIQPYGFSPSKIGRSNFFDFQIHFFDGSLVAREWIVCRRMLLKVEVWLNGSDCGVPSSDSFSHENCKVLLMMVNWDMRISFLWVFLAIFEWILSKSVLI